MHSGGSSQAYARPLIPLLLALMTGIVVGLWLPNLPGVVLAIVLAFLFSLLFVWKGQKVFLLPLFLFFTLGYWSLQSWTSPQLPANHVSRFVDDRPRHMMEHAAKRLSRFGLEVHWPRGSFYLFPKHDKGSGLAERLLNQAKVAVVDGEHFGRCGKGHFRISCSVDERILNEGLSRIEEWFRTH